MNIPTLITLIITAFRYKINNHGYQDSPKSTATEQIGTETTSEQLLKVIQISDMKSQNRCFQSQQDLKNRSSKTRDPKQLLKQALFQNVEESTNEEPVEKRKGEQKKTPLTCRSNVDIVFTNENIMDAENSSFKPHKTVVKKKMPLRESSMDKENMKVS